MFYVYNNIYFKWWIFHDCSFILKKFLNFQIMFGLYFFNFLFYYSSTSDQYLLIQFIFCLCDVYNIQINIFLCDFYGYYQ
jgi:hypothetical protein